MRLLKNKIILLAISVLGIFGGLGLFIVVGNVYGYDEGISVKCNYKGNDLFLEGKLGGWEDIKIGDEYGSGAKLIGTVFNIIGGSLGNGDIKECTGINVDIESERLRKLRLDDGGSKLNQGNVSCPFSGYISFFKIKKEDEDTDNKEKYILVAAKCFDPDNPYQLLKEKGISEGSVLFKVDDVKPLALSYDGSSFVEGNIAVVDDNGNVVSKPVKDLILEATAPDWQPQFADVVALQLKTISYLVNQLKLQDSNFDISDILNSAALTGYYHVLGKIKFNTRVALADDVYQPITLKDIGILAQIQDGLLKKLVLGSNVFVELSHQLQDSLDNYTLGEIQDILGSSLDLAIDFVNSNFNQLTGYDNLSGEDWYQTYDEFVKMWKGEITDNLGFAIGFQQNLRKSNMEYLKNQLDTGANFNLLGIYNSYYEILQAVKGGDYAIVLKNIKDNPSNFSDNFNMIGDIIVREASEIGFSPTCMMRRICDALSNSGGIIGDIISSFCGN